MLDIIIVHLAICGGGCVVVSSVIIAKKLHAPHVKNSVSDKSSDSSTSSSSSTSIPIEKPTIIHMIHTTEPEK